MEEFALVSRAFATVAKWEAHRASPLFFPCHILGFLVRDAHLRCKFMFRPPAFLGWTIIVRRWVPGSLKVGRFANSVVP